MVARLLATLGFVVLLNVPTNQEDKTMRANNSYINRIEQLLQKLYESPSMSVYSEIESQCNMLELDTNSSYISEKLSNIRIEAKMVATGRYEPGFSFEKVKQNLLGDINNIESELIFRQNQANLTL